MNIKFGKKVFRKTVEIAITYKSQSLKKLQRSENEQNYPT